MLSESEIVSRKNPELDQGFELGLRGDKALDSAACASTVALP